MAPRRVSDTSIQQAILLHRQGRAAEAAMLYRAALTRDPRAFDPHYLLAFLSYQQGNLQEAQQLISRAVEIKPRSAEALTLLAGILLALDRPSDALAACDRLRALKPDDIEAAHNRAVILTRLERLDDAIAQYGKTLARRPDRVPALFNRGTLLARRDRHAEAIADFDRVLALAPDSVEALINRGNALVKLDRCDEALASYDRVLLLQPANLDALNNRGSTLKSLQRTAEAQATYEKALAVNPRHVDTLFNYGNLLLGLGQMDAALASYDKALVIAPRRTNILVARGNALQQSGDLERARQSYESALAADGDDFDALLASAGVLGRLGRVAEACAAVERMSRANSGNLDRLGKCAQTYVNLRQFQAATPEFRRMLALSSEDPVALCGLANCLMETCDWDELATAREKIVALERAGSRIDPLLYMRLTDDPARLLECARRFAPPEIADPAAPTRPPAAARGSKIRVAYLSPDFRNHPVACLSTQLFELHDRARFDLVGLSLGPDDNSDIRARIVAAFDEFHDVRHESDERIAELVRRLDVDILVDLGGYTEFGRLGVLASRPAPIQVNYLGYPGTLGAAFVDYVVADPVIAPFGHRAFFAEKIVHLPDCYQANDSKRIIATQAITRAEAGLPAEGVVFCSFNATFKLLPPTFDIWMRLLREVEGSVLWLLRTGDAMVANLRREAAARGVDPDRLVFAPKMPLPDHLARHRLADLFLDTLPYNAHTTASDALWAGLPVVTCRGEAFAARVAASLLPAVGLPDLVTQDLRAYEAMALRLARDGAERQALRARLERNLPVCPLFDTRRFCRHLERAYATMHARWLNGEPPTEFAVDPIAG